ncbi:GAF domain-containing protein [Roseateles sp. DB2]|uniref:sigma-54-dependent Fis family transcriptional regulator n=1 Tax=Roseateles sp. DB2 TaxID=3453717 RepID=UPI003EE845E3
MSQTPAGAGVPSASMLAAQQLHQQAIQHSHERSQAFGLQPTQAPDLHRLSDSALQEVQHRNARLCTQALPVMEMLYEQLAHAQSMVVLSDASGTVLHALGDPSFLARAQRVALSPGARWAEADKGTNAIGTALMTEAPTLVHGAEHYLRSMHFLTCSAAPIFDHKGALLGVLDVSGDRRSYHPHTLALASLAARLIESQWFADRFRQSPQLQMHGQAECLGTLQEGVLALAEDGHVLGINRRGLDLLGSGTATLHRESVQSLFGLSMDQLMAAAQHDQALPVQVPTRTEQALHTLFLKLRLPAQRLLSWAHPGAGLAPEGLGAGSPLPGTYLATPAPAMGSPLLTPSPSRTSPMGLQPPPLRETEALAIRDAIRAAGGNLSLAARQLGIGRSTLYRKLRQDGLLVPKG